MATTAPGRKLSVTPNAKQTFDPRLFVSGVPCASRGFGSRPFPALMAPAP